MGKTFAEKMAEMETKKMNGNWYPGCGGTEEPFMTRTGRKLLYVFQPSSGKHAYLDLMTDMILSDEEARMALGIY